MRALPRWYRSVIITVFRTDNPGVEDFNKELTVLSHLDEVEKGKPLKGKIIYGYEVARGKDFNILMLQPLVEETLDYYLRKTRTALFAYIVSDIAAYVVCAMGRCFSLQFTV